MLNPLAGHTQPRGPLAVNTNLGLSLVTSNLAAHYAARLETGLTDEDTMTTLTDHFASFDGTSGGATDPVYDDARLNGLPVIDIRATTSYFTTSEVVSGTGGMTVFIVGYRNTGAGADNSVILRVGTQGVAGGWLGFFLKNPVTIALGLQITFSGVTISDETPYLLTFRVPASAQAQDIECWVGTTKLTNDSSSTQAINLAGGNGIPVWSGGAFDGYFAEQVLYSAPLTDGQIATNQAFLNSIYGL